MTYLSISYPLFAEDTKCLKTITTINDSTELQKDLNLMNGWSIDTDLLFNFSKIFFMSFKPHLSTSYSIGSNVICSVLLLMVVVVLRHLLSSANRNRFEDRIGH